MGPDGLWPVARAAVSRDAGKGWVERAEGEEALVIWELLTWPPSRSQHVIVFPNSPGLLSADASLQEE